MAVTQEKPQVPVLDVTQVAQGGQGLVWGQEAQAWLSGPGDGVRAAGSFRSPEGMLALTWEGGL